MAVVKLDDVRDSLFDFLKKYLVSCLVYFTMTLKVQLVCLWSGVLIRFILCGGMRMSVGMVFLFRRVSCRFSVVAESLCSSIVWVELV
jgi:cytochrome c oxidase subunit IV